MICGLDLFNIVFIINISRRLEVGAQIANVILQLKRPPPPKSPPAHTVYTQNTLYILIDVFILATLF